MTRPKSIRRYDGITMGGGLAALCLARQLRKSLPALDILMVERHHLPVMRVSHEFGESTVEIAARCSDPSLGPKQHPGSNQLEKFGLRYFVSRGGQERGRVTKVSTSRYLATPRCQLDCGVFENFPGEADAAPMLASLALASPPSAPRPMEAPGLQ